MLGVYPRTRRSAGVVVVHLAPAKHRVSAARDVTERAGEHDARVDADDLVVGGRDGQSLRL